ncbi:MAG: type II secretion system protein GspK [Tepidisphaeraceae bacterium]
MQASANQISSYEADAVERGAEQYVMGLLTDQRESLTTLDSSYFEQIPVGKGYFWLVRPDYLDSDLPQFGLVDESSKLNLNTISADDLSKLVNMDEDIAGSIVDWRDEDDEPTNGGAESSIYLADSVRPHRAKNAPFETVDELLLVHNVTPELFYGQAALSAGTGASTSTIIGGEALDWAGWQNYFTVWNSTTSNTGTTTASNRVNINQAPRDVLLTLPTLEEADVDKILSARPAAIESDPTSTTWVSDAIGRTLPQQLTQRITGAGRQFSADIVAVSGDGRSFKHVRIVVDTLSTPVQIVYRRDLSDRGFPLDASILTSLRAGKGIGGSF